MTSRSEANQPKKTPGQVRRVTDLASPPVVGTMYLVPTVRHRYHTTIKAWPVFPVRHTDAEIIGFPDVHYHIDPRFLSERDFDLDGFDGFQRYPLARQSRGNPEDMADPPEPVWKRRKCLRSDLRYVHGHIGVIRSLRDFYVGQTAHQGRSGWICPHKAWPLGSVAPDDDGIITCPLHGLRIRATDGVCLSTGSSK